MLPHVLRQKHELNVLLCFVRALSNSILTGQHYTLGKDALVMAYTSIMPHVLPHLSLPQHLFAMLMASSSIFGRFQLEKAAASFRGDVALLHFCLAELQLSEELQQLM